MEVTPGSTVPNRDQPGQPIPPGEITTGRGELPPFSGFALRVVRPDRQKKCQLRNPGHKDCDRGFTSSYRAAARVFPSLLTPCEPFPAPALPPFRRSQAACGAKWNQP